MLTSGSHPRSASPADPLEFLRVVSAALEQTDLGAALAAAADARSRGLLRVAVLGQFKRGKSTLLNALVGRNVLPSGVLPLTTVPTEVRDGPDALLVDTDRDGPTRHPLSELAEFVTEERNPDNSRSVRRVQVQVPLPAWARDVVFVDSPGIGSVHEQATSAAHRMLAEVDAAILVLSPDPPVSRVELDFLRDARAFAAKLFVVINKIDLLPVEARTQLVDYTRRVLREGADLDRPQLYLISARRVLEGRGGPPSHDSEEPGWDELVSDLDRYLGRDRHASVREVERHQTGLYSARLLDVATLSLKSLTMSDRDFARASGAVVALLERIPDERRAADALLDGDVREVLVGLDRKLAAFREQEQEPVRLALDEFLRTVPASGAATLVREFDRHFRQLLTPRVEHLRELLTESLRTDLDAAFRRYERRVAAVLDSIDRAAASSFEVNLTSLASQVPLADSERYIARVSGLYDGTFAGQTSLILPAFLLRGRVRRALGRTVSEELDAQSGRVRTDLIDRALTSAGRFKESAAARIARNTDSVQNAVRLGRAHREDALAASAAWRRNLEAWMEELRTLSAELPSATRTRINREGGVG